jgi:hypothetical protein
MPQGRHGLFRRGAFAAARGHRPSINVRISPPEQSARLQRLTLQEVPFTPLLAWPRGLSPSADVEVSYEIADDLYLLDVVVRDFHAGESVLDRQHQLDAIEQIGSEIVREVRFTRDKLDVDAELFGDERAHIVD